MIKPERETAASLRFRLGLDGQGSSLGYWLFVYFVTAVMLALGFLHPFLPIALLTWTSCASLRRSKFLELRVRELEDRHGITD